MKNKELEELIEKLTELQSKEELVGFLKMLLSPKELEEIPRRYQIAKLLKQGLPQREIAKKLGVGIATVTRGSKELKLKRFKAI